jgi:hypothetical protein
LSRPHAAAPAIARCRIASVISMPIARP